MYKCECGKEFDKPACFNGHKSHCLIHLKALGKLDSYLERSEIYKATVIANGKKYAEKQNNLKKDKLLIWISEKHTCEKCGKVMTEKFGSGRFCSRSCSNSREQTAETKNKISKSIQKSYNSSDTTNIIVKNRKQAEQEYSLNPKHCICCDKIIPFEQRSKKTCGNLDCIKSLQVEGSKKGGKLSSQKRVLRSKNEIYFCWLCEQYFNLVKHNEPIFNGWDADIIIEDIKYAILWNGPWHYVQLFEKQNLSQIQNRDTIKLKEIKKCGYIPYIIRDDGGYNPEFVEQEFNIFINRLNDII